MGLIFELVILLDLIDTISNYIQDILILGVFIPVFIKNLRLPPAKFFTSFSSSVSILPWNVSGPINFKVSFIWDICCCDFCCIVCDIDQLCFGTHIGFGTQSFEGINASFFKFLKEELYNWKELLDVKKCLLFA